jgi:arylsulfatase A-like enzyme
VGSRRAAPGGKAVPCDEPRVAGVAQSRENPAVFARAKASATRSGKRAAASFGEGALDKVEAGRWAGGADASSLTKAMDDTEVGFMVGLHVTDPSARARSASRALVVMSLWFGILAGLLEVGTALAQDALDPKVTVEDIRTNRHWIWMVPLSNAALFGALGLLLGLASRTRLGRFWRFAPYALGTLAWLTALVGIRGLHPAAVLVLAGGLGTQTGRYLVAREAQFARSVRISLPYLALAVLGLICLHGAWVGLRENRARTIRPGAASAAKNVLLLVMDNVRADHLSLYGYPRDTTPNLERWARSGVCFGRARATAPWTLPSHASMLTGRWPHELSTTVERPLDATYPTLAEFLERHGYATAGFVANTYYCNAIYGLDRGFARYEDFYDNLAVTPLEILRSSHLGKRLVELAGAPIATPGGTASRKTAAMINRDALSWIDAQRREGRPFFAFLNYYDAHGPLEPPAGYRRQFGLSTRESSYRVATLRGLRQIGRPGAARVPGETRSDEQLSREGAQLLEDSYDDCIAYLDSEIARLLEALDRRGVLEDTLVVVTSDHGEHFGDRGLFGHGHSLYGELLDVPLLVLPPGAPPETSNVPAPVSLRNLPATIVDVLGLTKSSPFPGLTLGRFWDADRSHDRLAAAAHPPLSEVEHQTKFAPSAHIPASVGPLWSVVVEDLVYIRRGDGHEELYDSGADPDERNNLATHPAARPRLERLRETLDRVADLE